MIVNKVIENAVNRIMSRTGDTDRVFAIARDKDDNRVFCCKYRNSDILYKVGDNYKMTDEVLEDITFERYATTFDV